MARRRDEGLAGAGSLTVHAHPSARPRAPSSARLPRPGGAGTLFAGEGTAPRPGERHGGRCPGAPDPVSLRPTPCRDRPCRSSNAQGRLGKGPFALTHCFIPLRPRLHRPDGPRLRAAVLREAPSTPRGILRRRMSSSPRRPSMCSALRPAAARACSSPPSKTGASGTRRYGNTASGASPSTASTSTTAAAPRQHGHAAAACREPGHSRPRFPHPGAGARFLEHGSRSPHSVALSPSSGLARTSSAPALLRRGARSWCDRARHRPSLSCAARRRIARDQAIAGVANASPSGEVKHPRWGCVCRLPQPLRTVRRTRRPSLPPRAISRIPRASRPASPLGEKKARPRRQGRALSGKDIQPW